MKLKLDLRNRILLKSLLASHTGRYPELALAKKVADEVLSDNLVHAFNIILASNGQFRYAAKDEKGHEFKPEITYDLKGQALEMITKDLKMLEEAGALKAAQVELYEMIVLEHKPK